ncbi:helix-turn-helix domain-containing protein [Ruixingdingia sedimenti]|uniref:Helix-turn-helix domain-containing protein n=1 Tax=Ruixingdingia sedimenti TaxID=3073604 RepID=A0ABU1F976_9RHOB|nr:helix-turn-helix domain-containing protein [Xinfangfangia sp. LG-4]MDR5653168.1 helix-turn-helix domain-containing protein [Xinfangfangia sp. LG-4]
MPAHSPCPPPRDGADLWQEAVSAAYFPLETECRDRAGFRGALEIWPLGPIALTRIRCDGVLYRRRAGHLRDDRESALLISVPGAAQVTFRQYAREARCPPGGFVIERSDAPYEYWHREADTQWVVKVPADSIRARIGDLHRCVALAVDARQGVAGYFLAGLRNAVAHLDGLDAPARQLAGQHLLEVLCLALRGDERALASADSTVQAAHLDRAQDFIRANLKTPGLSPQDVADACGISLRYLQRLFAASGQTVGGHIRDCRLARCDEDLRAGHRGTIAQIAYRWGFSDQAQFSRHYRSRFGRTPTEARQTAR